MRRISLILAVIISAALPTVAKSADRQPLPDAKVVDAAIKEVRQLFATEYASRDAQKTRKLIETLLVSAHKAAAGSPDQFACLQEAARLAFRSSDSGTAFQAIDELGKVFEVSPIRLKLELLDQISSRVALVQIGRAHQALELVTAAVSGGEHALALRGIELAQRSAKLARATGLSRFLVIEQKWLEENKRALAALGVAAGKLTTMPDDSAANQVAGHYNALLLGDWAKGLAFLAKGNNASQKAAAASELKSVKTAAEQEQLGDQWLVIASQLDGRAKSNVVDHAVGWLERAKAKTEGLEQRRLEKKIEAAVGQREAIRGRRREVIAADTHRGVASPNGSTATSFTLNSPYPVELKRTRLVCGISMDDKPGWTTDGDIEVSLDGVKWKLVGKWNSTLARKSSQTGHQISFSVAPVSPIVSRIQVRFRLSKGHSLYISQVLWVHE
jgi:hypothetical protein